MNQIEIERRASLLRGAILDFSNVPARLQTICMEYELARECSFLRTAVATIRRFNGSLRAGCGETSKQAVKRTEATLSESERREREVSENRLFGYDWLLEFAGYPEKPWKETLPTSVNGLFDNPEEWEMAPQKNGKALHFWGYATERNFKHVQCFQQRGHETATSEPFILLRVNLDGNNKTMQSDLARHVAYLRRKFDSDQEARRFAKKRRRPSGENTDFESFVRSLNAMRVLSGAEFLGLQHSEIVACVSACGFSQKAKDRGSRQRYPGVEAAKEAKDRFVTQFQRAFGTKEMPLTISDPALTLGLKV